MSYENLSNKEILQEVKELFKKIMFSEDLGKPGDELNNYDGDKKDRDKQINRFVEGINVVELLDEVRERKKKDDEFSSIWKEEIDINDLY